MSDKEVIELWRELEVAFLSRDWLGVQRVVNKLLWKNKECTEKLPFSDPLEKHEPTGGFLK